MPLAIAMARAARSARRTAHSRAFVLGLLAGLVYFGGTTYWTSGVTRMYGGLSAPVAVLCSGLLAAYMALFPGVCAWAMSRLLRAIGLGALLLLPAAWVATELLRAHLFGGFPWVLLGSSQTTMLPIAQLASVTGVFGLSGLVALVNAALAYAAAGGRSRAAIVAVAVSAVLVTGMWGAHRMRRDDLVRSGTVLRVGLLQGNIAQDEKWDPAQRVGILARYLRLTREAARQGARFIVWPESATPFFFEEDPVGGAAVRAVAQETGAHVLVGSDQLERATPPRYYNAAFLLGPDGRTIAVYRKIHLVPFGEYVPFKRLLFFVAPLVESVADFTPGADAVRLPLGVGAASAAICYEVVYPDLIRRFVLAGSQLLTAITNDAWYGRSSAPYQHFEQATLRSIEEGRYLVRAANTGISGIVDPYGRVLDRSPLFEEAVIVGDVRLIDVRTIYARIGDLFAYLCAALTIAALLATRRAPSVAPARSTSPQPPAPSA